MMMLPCSPRLRWLLEQVELPVELGKATEGLGGGTEVTLLDIVLPRWGASGEGLGGEASRLNGSTGSRETIGVGVEIRLVRGTVSGEAGALSPNVSGKGTARGWSAPPSNSHNVGREIAEELARGLRETSCNRPMGDGLGRRGSADWARRWVGRTGLPLPLSCAAEVLWPAPIPVGSG